MAYGPEGIEQMRLTYWKANDNTEAQNVSIREAKKLLKEKGGDAWTEHYERDGTMFERTPVTPAGNNSNHRYNHHL